MKRDMELIRQLLFTLEKQNIDANGLRTIKPFEIEIEGYDVTENKHHLIMLADSPFLKSDGFEWSGALLFRGISWEGHEIINTIRDNEIWEKTVNDIKKKGVDGVISLIVEVAKAITKNKLSEILGNKI